MNDIGLTSRDDKQIASFAINRGMIIVTKNLADFERLYGRRLVHPGLIFMVEQDDVSLDLADQKLLMEVALEEVMRSEPIQEAIAVTLVQTSDGAGCVSIRRYGIPPHE